MNINTIIENIDGILIYKMNLICNFLNIIKFLFNIKLNKNK